MRRLSVAAALGATLICGLGAMSAEAGPPPGASDPDTQLDLPLEGQITHPDWRSQPSGDDMAKEYPKLAQLMDLAGRAAIRCAVDAEGRLQDCAVVSESPAGFGFGAAAVRLSAYFSMKPERIDGQPVRSTITIPIKFQLYAQSPAAPDPEAPPPSSPAALDLARQVLVLQGVEAQLKRESRPAIARLVREAVANGDIESSTAALDAFQQGLDDVIAATIERQARMMAANMTEAQLRATLDYLNSPAGKAWLATGVNVTLSSKDLLQRLGSAARKHLCASVACDSSGQPKE
jgi:TonB family protein